MDKDLRKLYDNICQVYHKLKNKYDLTYYGIKENYREPFLQEFSNEMLKLYCPVDETIKTSKTLEE